MITMDHDKLEDLTWYTNQRLPYEYHIDFCKVGIHGYDWNIFGKLCKSFNETIGGEKRYQQYVESYNRSIKLDHSNKIYSPIPSIDSMRSWLSFHYPLIHGVSWLEKEVFHPNKLMFENIKTSQIKLRIGFSMLDKITMPHTLRSEIQSHMIACFYARKIVYDKYYATEFLKLPF